MNNKKMSQCQFHFPGLLGTSPMLKQETIGFGDNPIYPFWEADGQDLDFRLKC